MLLTRSLASHDAMFFKNVSIYYVHMPLYRALKVQVQVQQLCQGRLKNTTIKYAERDRASMRIVNLPCSSNENHIA